MAGKIWPRIVIASAATVFTLLFLVLNVTANAPIHLMADDLITDFNAAPSSGNAPLTVHFSYIPIQGGITEWAWDFGDGEVGNGYNISHTYEKPGQYVATLTIKNGSGSQGHATKQITVYAGPSGPVDLTATPEPGSVSIIPGTIDTPRPPSGTAVPAEATPLPTAKASGITLSEDAVQLIIAGAIAVIIAAAIIFVFSNMSKRPGGKVAEKPAAKAKPPDLPGKSKVKDRAPKPVKKSEDVSQDYIYGLVTGKVESEAERSRVQNQNDYKKKN